jgi:hypothetical protein
MSQTALTSVAVALLGLLSGLLLALVNRRVETRARRREAYAAAMQILVEWIEYPYRIRRRTSDDPLELHRLADIGHDIQQRLRYHQTWIRLEHAPTGKLYAEVLRAISSRIGEACKDAWNQPPIDAAQGMNLGNWGPGPMRAELSLLEQAITGRFGRLRFLPWRGRNHVTRLRGTLAGKISAEATQSIQHLDREQPQSGGF